MKRPPDEKPDGAPEWMVSFADMITIMMSFFVIMFALASSDKGKHNEQKREAVVESFEYRFGPRWKPFSSWGIMNGNTPLKNCGGKIKPKPQPVPDGEGPSVPSKKPSRVMIPRLGQQIAIGGVVNFEGQAAELDEVQKQKLKGIAAELAGKPQQIEILGRASNRPLAGLSGDGDRWNLAFARCRKVADLLESMNIERLRIRMVVGRNGGIRTPGAGPSVDDADDRIDIYLTDRMTENMDSFVGQ